MSDVSAAPAQGPVNAPTQGNFPIPTGTALFVFGIPIAIILGGTRIGPIVNLSLVAVLVGIFVLPKKG